MYWLFCNLVFWVWLACLVVCICWFGCCVLEVGVLCDWLGFTQCAYLMFGLCCLRGFCFVCLLIWFWVSVCCSSIVALSWVCFDFVACDLWLFVFVFNGALEWLLILFGCFARCCGLFCFALWWVVYLVFVSLAFLGCLLFHFMVVCVSVGFFVLNIVLIGLIGVLFCVLIVCAFVCCSICAFCVLCWFGIANGLWFSGLVLGVWVSLGLCLLEVALFSLFCGWVCVYLVVLGY